MIKYIYLLAGFLLMAQAGTAQVFEYTSKVDSVTTNGFYKIFINPQLTGKLNNDFSDIRLFDEKEREVPYLLVREQPVQHKTLFKEYEVVNKTMIHKVETSLVLRNAAKNKINNISLLIKNSAVSKKAQLSGSNDAHSWYVIEDAYIIPPVHSASQTAETQLLNFPLSDYEFYKLDINDSLSAPLNILKVGYYDTYTENGKYTLISGITFQQKDSSAARQSFVKVSMNTPAPIDKIEFDIAGPSYYLRKATLVEPQLRKGKRGRKKTVFEPLLDLELHSQSGNTFYLTDFKAANFYLLIKNEDNPPLQITGVKAYQLNTYLVAELDKDKKYNLQFGNKQLSAPSYDLKYFKEKIAVHIPVIQTGKIIHVSQTDIINTPTLFISTLFIWAAICIVIAFLAYMTYQMLKENGQKKV